MKSKIICNNLIFEFTGKSTINILCHEVDYLGQTILTIDYSAPHRLYIWYDEGRFPKCIDTQLDKNHRKLRITGIDEL